MNRRAQENGTGFADAVLLFRGPPAGHLNPRRGNVAFRLTKSRAATRATSYNHTRPNLPINVVAIKNRATDTSGWGGSDRSRSCVPC